MNISNLIILFPFLVFKFVEILRDSRIYIYEHFLFSNLFSHFEIIYKK